MSGRQSLAWLASLAALSTGCALTEDWQSLRNGTSVSYEEMVANSEPLAYFPLHDAPGTTQLPNRGASTEPATVSTGVSLTGGGASFGGVGSIDLGGGYDFHGMATFTIEAWVEVSPSAPTQSVLLSDAMLGNDSIVQGYQVVLLGDGMGQVQRGAGIASCGAPFTYIPGAGFYLVVLYGQESGPNDFNLLVYVNGQPVAPAGNCTSVTDPSLAQTGHLLIGADANGDNNFTGIVSEVAVYSTLLTDQQITAHAAAGKKGP